MNLGQKEKNNENHMSKHRHEPMTEREEQWESHE